MIQRRLQLAAALLLPLVGGCLGNFNTPSAYLDQRYYCDDENVSEFRALFEGCRTDGDCVGAFSMRGTLQGQPLTVGVVLTDAVLGMVQGLGSPDRYYDILRIGGASPYFQFLFHLKSVGGLSGTDTSKLLIINTASRAQPNPLTDDQVDAGITLQVEGSSEEQIGLSKAGAISFTELSETKLSATFHGAFGKSTDAVEGCFIVQPEMTTVNPTPL